MDWGLLFKPLGLSSLCSYANGLLLLRSVLLFVLLNELIDKDDKSGADTVRLSLELFFTFFVVLTKFDIESNELFLFEFSSKLY